MTKSKNRAYNLIQIALVLFFIQNTFTEPIFDQYESIKKQDLDFNPENNRRYKEFISPNERHPKDAIPILSKAPEGIYIGVGADRTLNLPSLSENITRIVSIDYDPNVVQWNRINIELIKLSRNLDDYKKLRTQTSFSQLKERLKKELPKKYKYLESETLWTWWKQKRDSSSMEDFEKGPRIKKDFDDNEYFDNSFEKANYLHNQQQFEKLKKLANEDRLESHKLNLSDTNDIEKLNSSIKRSGEKISILDISNAWQHMYLGRKKTEKLISKLSKRTTKESLFLITAYWSPERSKYPTDSRFGYIATKFRNIRFKNIFKGIHDDMPGLEARETVRKLNGTIDGQCLNALKEQGAL